MAWGNGPIGRGKEVEYREKMQQALNLRKTGMTYPAIAKKLGYRDHSGARDLVQKALAELTREPAEELRDLELSRLDDVIRGLYPKVIKGDHNAVNSMIKAMDHRAKLTGLYIIENDNGQAAVSDKLDELMKSIKDAAKDSDLDASD